MMGEAIGRQDRLFYEFDLEAVVPAAHLLRRIDRALDLSWLRREMKPHYNMCGPLQDGIALLLVDRLSNLADVLAVSAPGETREHDAAQGHLREVMERGSSAISAPYMSSGIGY